MTGTYGSLRGFYREVDSISSGTLYLMFALFSGLLGTAFSVLVRRCVRFLFIDPVNLHSSCMLTASGLVGFERGPTNIACLLKALNSGNQVKL